MAVIELKKDNFESVITTNEFVIIDFWAPWCGPCRTFAPIYEKVSNNHEDIVFAKVNTEEEQELGGHFQIRSIPTLMIFREQIIIYSEAGMLPEQHLDELIGRARKLDMADVRRQIEEEHAKLKT